MASSTAQARSEYQRLCGIDDSTLQTYLRWPELKQYWCWSPIPNPVVADWIALFAFGVFILQHIVLPAAVHHRYMGKPNTWVRTLLGVQVSLALQEATTPFNAPRSILEKSEKWTLGKLYVLAFFLATLPGLWGGYLESEYSPSWMKEHFAWTTRSMSKDTYSHLRTAQFVTQLIPVGFMVYTKGWSNLATIAVLLFSYKLPIYVDYGVRFGQENKKPDDLEKAHAPTDEPKKDGKRREG